MNIKILQVCKEQKIKRIKPNHNISIITKRNAEEISKQDLMKSTSLTGHCGLPEHDEEFPTFIFVYNEVTHLNKITKSVRRYNRNSARVHLAVVVEQAHMIIFQMNRAAYLQVS